MLNLDKSRHYWYLLSIVERYQNTELKLNQISFSMSLFFFSFSFSFSFFYMFTCNYNIHLILFSNYILNTKKKTLTYSLFSSTPFRFSSKETQHKKNSLFRKRKLYLSNTVFLLQKQQSTWHLFRFAP